jgi:hypothetical protein
MKGMPVPVPVHFSMVQNSTKPRLLHIAATSNCLQDSTKSMFQTDERHSIVLLGSYSIANYIFGMYLEIKSILH